MVHWKKDIASRIVVIRPFIIIPKIITYKTAVRSECNVILESRQRVIDASIDKRNAGILWVAVYGFSSEMMNRILYLRLVIWQKIGIKTSNL